MTSSQKISRINLHDLKAQIVKQVGLDRANQYFNHFRSFINLKLRKAELEKLVVLTIGKENVALHNQLIRAVLSNAIRGEVPPPPTCAQDTSKPVKGIRRKTSTPSISNDDALLQNPPSRIPSGLSNGDSFTVSPLRGKSAIRDRKSNKEKPSHLGPLGRGELSLSQEVLGGQPATESGVNGELKTPDLFRPLQEIHGAVGPSDRELNGPSMPPGKRLRIFPRNEILEPERKGEANVLPVELEKDDADNGQTNVLLGANRFIGAPLGIPLCPGSVGSARKSSFVGVPPHLALLLMSGKEEEFLGASDLPNTESMQKWMDQIAAVEGLQGVSRECASLLKQALYIVLKRLIKACVNLVVSRTSTEQDQSFTNYRELLCEKEAKKDSCLPNTTLHQGLNGIWPGHIFQTFGSGGTNTVQKERSDIPVSLLDFKLAMELNSQQLGEDWPLQLERISFRLFEQ